jgi:hypothetical protein
LVQQTCGVSRHSRNTLIMAEKLLDTETSQDLRVPATIHE